MSTMPTGYEGVSYEWGNNAVGMGVATAQSFPHCCGAIILSGLEANSTSGKVDGVRDSFLSWLEYYGRCGIMAILSEEETSKKWFDLLELAGFENVRSFQNAGTGNMLHVYFLEPQLEYDEDNEGDEDDDWY